MPRNGSADRQAVGPGGGAVTDQTDEGTSDGWTPWAAIDDYSGFEVRDPLGRVAMAQTGIKNFAVTSIFRFDDSGTLDEYRRRLTKGGADTEDANRMLNDARTLSATELMTDLASVPRFMAWFEAPYGRHTLAAILHDKLIEDEPNTGALQSDTLADSFFRDMMGIAGVPLFKRWLMWAAVAARSRWVAKGLRRASLVLWGLLALAGQTIAVLAIVSIFGDLGSWDRPGLLSIAAFGLPFIAALLWGRQYGAGVVAAAAGIWLIPSAVIVAVGLLVYGISERIASVSR